MRHTDQERGEPANPTTPPTTKTTRAKTVRANRGRDLRALRDLSPGTLVLLPEEFDETKPAGYAEGGGSNTVLVPGHQSVHGVELPEPALVEVIATPYELAHAYLRSTLDRIDRRWRRRANHPKKPPEATGRKTGDGRAA